MMIDTYILLNRKTKLISKLFIYNILILIILMIYILSKFEYTSYFYSNSQITFMDNYFLLKINTSLEDIQTISKSNSIIINNKEYMYQIYKIENDVMYENNNQYQVIYLKILNLEEYYWIENYSLNIKIEKERKVLIDYLK